MITKTNKAKVAVIASELVNDLNAVRSAVLNKQSDMTQTEYARLEPRLFESWAIEKLAESEFLLLSLGQQIVELRQELKDLRKSLPRPSKTKSK